MSLPARTPRRQAFFRGARSSYFGSCKYTLAYSTLKVLLIHYNNYYKLTDFRFTTTTRILYKPLFALYSVLIIFNEVRIIYNNKSNMKFVYI